MYAKALFTINATIKTSINPFQADKRERMLIKSNYTSAFLFTHSSGNE